MYKRDVFNTLLKRLEEPRRFIQVLAGPRQVGKTTLVQQTLKALKMSSVYVSADEATLRDRQWIDHQWELARLEKKSILVLDEIQKIPQWSENVKRLWDEDTRRKTPLKVVLLGSAPLLMQRGLTESLAGRFERIPLTHWSYQEMQDAFGWTLEQYIYFGGYPGAADLIDDETRWKHYINDSLIETTLSRDVMLLNPINKPALLRRLFQLGCHYSGQIFSFQKMLGQLQDVGNTTTLAHYLELLNAAGMVTGLSKFAGKAIRQRASSPKLQVLNTALMSAQGSKSFHEAHRDRDYWGRCVESCIGAYLINTAFTDSIEVFYWRERNFEVNFVLKSGKKIIPIEVKSGIRKSTFSGLEAFCKEYNVKRSLVVGEGSLSVEKFLKTPLNRWFEE